MISCTKAILIALYCATLTASVSGRDSIAENPSIGGAGNGSAGPQDKAVSETSSNVALVPAEDSSATVVIFYNNDEKDDEKDNDKNNDKNDEKDDKNNDKNNDKDDKNNDKNNDKNDDKDEDKNDEKDNFYVTIDDTNKVPTGGNTAYVPVSNPDEGSGISDFGDHGTLADREVDVLCHICEAVPDHSYFDTDVDVGHDIWSCGYLQETLQDVNPNSGYVEEFNLCRHSQLMAERDGCCAKTMHIDTPGKNLNGPCDLCGGDGVRAQEFEKLVETDIVGKHTCGSIEGIMKDGMISSDRCPVIRKNIKDDCCKQHDGWGFGFAWASQRSGEGLLRGGVP